MRRAVRCPGWPAFRTNSSLTQHGVRTSPPARAEQLDDLARRGQAADRLLDLAAAGKPLPVEHPTAALAYRVKELVTPRKRKPQTIDPFLRSPQLDNGQGLGL